MIRRQPGARAWLSFSPLVALVAIAAVAVAQPARTVAAEEAGSPEARQAASEVYPLLLAGYLDQLAVPTTEMRWQELEPGLREANPDLGDDALAELREELAGIHARFYIEVIEASAPAALAAVFSAAELRELAEFHRTAIGEKAARALPGIIARAFAPLMRRMPELQTQFNDDFDEVLRARGLR